MAADGSANNGSPRRRGSRALARGQLDEAVVQQRRAGTHRIFGVFLLTDNSHDLLSGSPGVPPAQLSKGIVVTRLSRLDKIIIRAQSSGRSLILVGKGRPHFERNRCESAGFIASIYHRFLLLHPRLSIERGGGSTSSR